MENVTGLIGMAVMFLSACSASESVGEPDIAGGDGGAGGFGGSVAAAGSGVSAGGANQTGGPSGAGGTQATAGAPASGGNGGRGGSGGGNALPANAPKLVPGVWTPINPTAVSFGPRGTGRDQDIFTQGMAIDPSNPTTIYLTVCANPEKGTTSTPGLYRS